MLALIKLQTSMLHFTFEIFNEISSPMLKLQVNRRPQLRLRRARAQHRLHLRGRLDFRQSGVAHSASRRRNPRRSSGQAGKFGRPQSGAGQGGNRLDVADRFSRRRPRISRRRFSDVRQSVKIIKLFFRRH
jgi:hypothetical protein